MEYGHVLESSPAGKQSLDNHSGFSDNIEFLLCHLADYSCCKSGTRERNAVEHLFRKSGSAACHPDSILAELDQRFKYMVPESLLRVNSELGKYIVLALDACNSLVDISQDGSLQEVPGSALPYDPPEYLFIECLGNGFPFLFRIGYSLKGFEELLLCVDDLNLHAKLCED